MLYLAMSLSCSAASTSWAQQCDGPVPVISSSGIGSWHDTPKCSGLGVVVGRKGSLGTVFYVECDYWPHDTTLWVRNFRGNDPAFCYLLLKTLRLRELDAGAANPTLNRNHAHRLPVRVTDVDTQRRVAEVMFTFDRLIQNISVRIQILKETAQALYQEWFVRYRFAGHESVEFIESSLGAIPGGWTVEPFSDFGRYLNGFAFKPVHLQSVGVPIIKIKELKNGVTPSMPRYPGDDIREKFRVVAGDLLFSWSGDLNAYLWPGPDGWLNQHLFRVDEEKGVPRSWLFLALSDRMHEFRLRSQGTTMKHIQRSALDQVHTVRPTTTVLSAFDALASPLPGLVIDLHLQSAALPPRGTFSCRSS